MANGANQLADGGSQLANGTVQVAEGSSKLAEGSVSLASGASLLSNGATNALFAASSSLGSTADTLGGLTGIDEDTLGDYFLSPVELERNKLFPVNSYGSDVSPFYLVLSMWVGAVITCVMLKPGTSQGTKYSPFEMYFGKLLTYIIMSILQACVTIMGCYLLGIQIVNPILFIASCILLGLGLPEWVACEGAYSRKGYWSYPLGSSNICNWRSLSNSNHAPILQGIVSIHAYDIWNYIGP